MPYDPYAGGWITPGWWNPTPGRWHPYDPEFPIGAAQANALKFLNTIMPMMRTETDMLELARAMGAMAGKHGPFGGYAGQTATAGQAFAGDPAQRFQQALQSMVEVQHGTGRGYAQRKALQQWLQGLWGLAEQHGKTPTAPGAPRTATREQERGFGQAFGQALKRGPAGAGMYAPWMQRLFQPSVSRPMPGQYQYDPQSRRWDILRNPRFF